MHSQDFVVSYFWEAVLVFTVKLDKRPARACLILYGHVSLIMCVCVCVFVFLCDPEAINN